MPPFSVPNLLGVIFLNYVTGGLIRFVYKLGPPPVWIPCNGKGCLPGCPLDI